MCTRTGPPAWGPRRQRRSHCVVLLLPLLVLPLALPSDARPAGGRRRRCCGYCARWQLSSVCRSSCLATTGPLLQKRYSWLGLDRSSDPYFLFAASNLGSFVGLLAYPFLIEPFFSLDQQERLWSIGFVVFIALTGCCLLLPGGSRAPGTAATGAAETATDPESEEVAVRASAAGSRIVRWTALAFLPSALMLAVTSHITTDIAAIPLLWVLPLAIYLATFVGCLRAPLASTAGARDADRRPAGCDRLVLRVGERGPPADVVRDHHPDGDAGPGRLRRARAIGGRSSPDLPG